MDSQNRFPSSVLRTIGRTAAVALIMALAALPARAQNTVPSTAREAAASPAFAPKLHPSTQSTANKPLPSRFNRTARNVPAGPYSQSCTDQDSPSCGPPPQLTYNNGPINGLCDIQGCTVDAWTINSGYTVTNSFPGSGAVNYFNFAFWMFPGDTMSSLDWALGTAPFASDLGSGTASGGSLITQLISSNQYGYDIDAVTVKGLNVNLSAGAWLTLANASVASGDPVYWDENAGPSQADESAVGTIPSESFNVDGSTGGGGGGFPPCMGPGGGLNILHNFTQNENGQFGAGSLALTIDSTGNLYGTTANGGGLVRPAMVYELALRGQDWIFTPIYYFAGENLGGFGPGLNKVGKDGTLYGIANTPLTCGQDYECGLIFSLKPPPTSCGTAFCSWTESTLHWFTGGSDGWGPVGLTSDNQGNLYGTALLGGTYGNGVVYELTPSGGGWAENVLYSFTGGSDGGTPGGSLLVGNDGNLYGVTWNGGDYGFGVVYQLVPSAGGWVEHVLHAFDGQSDGIAGGYLRQDSSGNLYGASDVHYSFGTLPEKIFMLSPSNGGWVFTIIWQTQHQYEYIGGLAMDADGNLYGVATNSGESNQVVFEIFKRTQDGQFHGWLKSGYYFPSEFGVVVDKGGNLYGTTDFCGTWGYGTVWQFTGLPDL